jgi:hypothetical protein
MGGLSENDVQGPVDHKHQINLRLVVTIVFIS